MLDGCKIFLEVEGQNLTSIQKKKKTDLKIKKIIIRSSENEGRASRIKQCQGK